MSEATAATTRNGAAAGTETRSLSLVVRSATESAAATSRIAAPNTVTSCTAADRILPAAERRPTSRSRIPYISVIRGILGGILCLPMRRLILTMLVFALLVSPPPRSRATAPATARSSSPTRGCAIVVQGNGVIFGHIDSGTLTVTRTTRPTRACRR